MSTTDKKLLEGQAAVQPTAEPPASTPPATQQAPQQNVATQQQPTQQPAQTQQTQQQTQRNDLGNLLNMPGVSDATKQTLGGLVTNGYKPSQNVSAAMQELQNVISQQPAAFQSQHMGELNNILNQILGRKNFSYDMSNDPFYQNYRQMYMNAGKQAMQDTVGQMSALTGGYGNSYAATAGQQQYNQYLQQLNDRIPELQGMALDRYNAEGDLLGMKYGMLNDAYNREYGEWQDQYNRWLGERDFAQGNYESERNFDYGQYSDDVNNWFDIAGMEQQQGNADRDYYFDWAMTLLENGKMPTADTLLKAGLSEEEVRLLFMGSGSGGSGSSSKSGSGKSDYDSKEETAFTKSASTSAGKIPGAVSSAISNGVVAGAISGINNTIGSNYTVPGSGSAFGTGGTGAGAWLNNAVGSSTEKATETQTAKKKLLR